MTLATSAPAGVVRSPGALRVPGLIGTTPADPLIYAIVVVCFGIVALVASFVPARRAIRIDPAEALRIE